MKRFGLTLVLVVLPSAARADTFIWDQPAFGVFHFGSSWQGGVAPGPGDQALMGATLTTVFDPVTVQFLENTEVLITDLMAGDYIFEAGNPGVQHVTALLRVGADPLLPEFPDSATLRLEGIVVQENPSGTFIGNNGQYGSLVLVSAPASLVSSDIWVAPSADGSLEILAGSQVEAGGVHVGGPYSTTAQGSIWVDGAGSRLESTGIGSMEIGRSTPGSLLVTNGASVTAGFASAGTFVEGDGTINVDGAGTSLTSAGVLEIGRDGVGTLTVSNGASVTAASASAGAFSYPGTQGAITVEGVGSSLSVAGELEIGRDAVGSLTIREGAVVSALRAVAGAWPQPTSNGTIAIDGPGSQLLNDRGARIGRYAPGSLTIAGGAELRTATAPGYFISDVGTFPGGAGSVTISGIGNGQSSRWVDSGSIWLGRFGGTGMIEVLDEGLLSTTYGLYIESASRVTVSETSYVTLGNAGPVAGAVSVSEGAVLSGRGTLDGDVLNNAGTVSPDGALGASVGLLTVNGDFQQAASGSLAIELGGETPGAEYDVLAISGNATPAGALTVTLAANYSPPRGAAFDVLSANLIEGEFDSVYLPPLAADQRWHLAYGLQAVSLTVVATADLDNDGDIDLDDFALFAPCLQGPSIPPAPVCELADLELDADVDLLDFARLQTAFGG